MAPVFTRETESLSMGALSLVLIGPNEQRRRTLARVLAGAQAIIACEIPRYPQIDDLANILEADFDVAIVDLDPDPERALDVVENLCSAANSLTVMVYSAHGNADLLLRCMRAGARELLAEPVVSSVAAEALVRASVRREEVRRHKTTMGKLLIFVGAKGGSGVTTVACNFAVALANHAKVALVDLDLQLGDAALMLGLNSEFTVLDAIENLHRLDSDFLSGLMTKHTSGLAVLGAPDVIPSLQPSSNGMERLIRLAREDFTYVVVDAGSHSVEMYEALFSAASAVYLIAQVSVADLRNANRFIARYFSGAEAEKLEIVLNRYAPRNFEIDDGAITRALTRSPKWKIPNDFTAARSAQNSGIPLAFGKNQLARKFAEMAAAASGDSALPEKRKIFGFI